MADAKEIIAAHFNREIVTVGGLIDALDAAGYFIVPKEIPEAFVCEHGFDHDDTEEYAAMVEHLAVRP